MAFDVASLLFHNRNDLAAFSAIVESPSRFYLTGSRYFGGTDNNSDWDFFVQDTESVREELEKVGFRYIDSESENAYSGICRVNKIMELGKFHIQLVQDAAEKECLQVNIRRNVTMSALTKDQRKEIWRLAYAMVAKAQV